MRLLLRFPKNKKEPLTINCQRLYFFATRIRWLRQSAGLSICQFQTTFFSVFRRSCDLIVTLLHTILHTKGNVYNVTGNVETLIISGFPDYCCYILLTGSQEVTGSSPVISTKKPASDAYFRSGNFFVLLLYTQFTHNVCFLNFDIASISSEISLWI